MVKSQTFKLSLKISAMMVLLLFGCNSDLEVVTSQPADKNCSSFDNHSPSEMTRECNDTSAKVDDILTL